MLAPLLALVPLLLPAAPHPAPAATGGARLVADEPVADFGEVFDGAVLEHRFPLRVEGSGALTVHKIKPSCGCTLARLWRLGPGEPEPVAEGTALEPGTRLELEARFETARRLGSQRKPVVLYTDGDPPRFEVRIEARVRSVLRAVPELLRLGRFSVREAGTATAELETVDGEPIGLVRDPGAEATAPEGLAVELEPLDPDAEGRASRWRVTARLERHPREGFVRHRLVLRTDRLHPGAPRGEDGAPAVHTFELPLEAQVLGVLVAKPRSLAFGLLGGDAEATRTLRVNGYDPELELSAPEVRLLDLESDEPFAFAGACEVRVTEVPEVRSAFDVELAVGDLPPAFEGAFRGRLELDFGPELPLLHVPFTGFHRPADAPDPTPPGRDER